MATGSEVAVALDAAKALLEKGIALDVASMPSFYRFEMQSKEKKEAVLCFPRDKRVSLEMASTFGWDKYADHHIGLDEYGASGKENDLYAHYGFTKDKVVEALLALFPKE